VEIADVHEIGERRRGDDVRGVDDALVLADSPVERAEVRVVRLTVGHEHLS